jgi:hypothetical protein
MTLPLADTQLTVNRVTAVTIVMSLPPQQFITLLTTWFTILPLVKV